jgi:hypothetical protein
MAPRLLEKPAGYYNRDCRACPVVQDRRRQIHEQAVSALLQRTNNPQSARTYKAPDFSGCGGILDNAGETRDRARMVTNEK